MKKTYFEIKEGAHGLLDDGRRYQIIAVPTITMCSDGSFLLGDVKLSIDGSIYTIRISEFVDHIRTIGNLVVR